MTITLEQSATTQTAIDKPSPFSIAQSQIAQLASEYMPLVILDVADKEQFAAVHDARMVMVKLRTGLDKERKKLTANLRKAVDDINDDAKKLFDEMEPIESHLTTEENKVKEHEKRLAAEAAEQKKEQTRSRHAKLAECGAMMMQSEFEDLSSGDFSVLLQRKQVEKKARDEREAEDAAERARVAEQQRIEQEKLAADRAEFDRQRKEQEAANAKIKAEQAAAQAKIDVEAKRIADAEAAHKREVELENAKREAAEKAVRDAEEKRQRDEAAAKAKAEADDAARKREEELRPDFVKTNAVADAIDAIILPSFSPEFNTARADIKAVLADAADSIRSIADRYFTTL